MCALADSACFVALFVCGHGCDCVTLAARQADNVLGVEGVKALAPELAKLTQLQRLNLYCE